MRMSRRIFLTLAAAGAALGFSRISAAAPRTREELIAWCGRRFRCAQGAPLAWTTVEGVQHRYVTMATVGVSEADAVQALQAFIEQAPARSRLFWRLGDKIVVQREEVALVTPPPPWSDKIIDGLAMAWGLDVMADDSKYVVHDRRTLYKARTRLVILSGVQLVAKEEAFPARWTTAARAWRGDTFSALML